MPSSGFTFSHHQQQHQQSKQPLKASNSIQLTRTPLIPHLLHQPHPTSPAIAYHGNNHNSITMSHYTSNNMKSSCMIAFDPALINIRTNISPAYSPKSSKGSKMDVETASISTYSSSASSLKSKSKPSSSSSSWTPEKIQSQAFMTQGR